MARRKRKVGDKFLGRAIVFLAVIYLFIWLYKQLGGVGCLILILCLFGGWFYISNKKKTKNAESFEADALLALSKRLDPDTARTMIAKYSMLGHRRGELLRFIQIFNDSIEISLSSKKIETAESRFSLAKETYQKIKTYRNIMRPRLISEIDSKFQHLTVNFVATLTLNAAKAHIEKAGSLKTEKSKLKYLQEALNVLEDGISRGADTSLEVLALTEEIRTKVGKHI